MKKVMWISFGVEIAALSILLALIIMQKAIPDLLFIVFCIGMCGCVGSSFFVRRASIEGNE